MTVGSRIRPSGRSSAKAPGDPVLAAVPLSELAGPPVPAELLEPVFIGGYPRSGTSLLVALLDGHPDLLVLPEETWFLKDVSRRSFASTGEAVDYLLSRTNLRHLDPAEPPGPEEQLGVGIPDYSGFPFGQFRDRTLELARASTGAPPEILRSLGEAFAEATGAGSRRFLVEKTPDNEFRMATARTWWPRCRFVYLVRDPRAVFHSHASKTSGASAGSRRLLVETFVLHYARSLAVGLRHIALAPGLATLVKYEDLVTAPESEMRRMCRFLEIGFDASLVAPTKLRRPWRGVGSAGEVGEHVVAGRIDAWRDGLDRSDVAYIETFLGKAMLLLGYQLATGLVSSREFLTSLRGPLSTRVQTLRAVASLYKPVGIVRRRRAAGGRGR
jgi:hypothetical protein